MVKADVKSKKLIELAELLLKFARVERVTLHEDGLRAETDADHTVMLGIMGCAVAQQLRPDLDVGKIAQYCLVHDLVEVYAGDTSTLLISDSAMRDKKSRERVALKRLSQELGSDFPWIIQTIKSYEKLDTPEARFVKTLDKIVPKFTHILNSGKHLRDKGIPESELKHLYLQRQHMVDMVSYAYDQPELMAVRLELAKIVLAKTYPKPKQTT